MDVPVDGLGVARDLGLRFDNFVSFLIAIPVWDSPNLLQNRGGYAAGPPPLGVAR